VSFNAAMLKQMQVEGLNLDACIRVLEAAERKSDPTNAQRQARFRANKKAKAEDNGVTVTGVTPPNDIDNLTPRDGSEAKASSPYPAPEGVSDDVWGDFLKSPKRRKAGMSKTAYAGITNNLKILAEHGFPPGEMIALAVERGWITVKLEWVQNERRPANSNTIGKSAAAYAMLNASPDEPF